MADYDIVMQKIDYLDDTKHQIKDAIIEKGQQIEDNDPFRDYVEKIKELTTGDIRLFNTIDEMNNDQKPKKDGDLAVVYNRTLEPITNDITFGSIEIPKVINIGSISENQNRVLYAMSNVDGLYGELYIDIPRFSSDYKYNAHIMLRNTKQCIELQYSVSDDGLTYTFDSGNIRNETLHTQSTLEFNTDSLIFDFENNLTIRKYDSVFDGLFNVCKLDFQGLFEYKLNNLKEHTTYFGKNPHINTNTNNVDIDLVDWLDFSLFGTNLRTLTNKTTFDGLMEIGTVENHQPYTLVIHYDCNIIVNYNNKLYLAQGATFTDLEQAQNYIANKTYTYGEVDFVNWTYVEHTGSYKVLECTLNENTIYHIVKDEYIDENTLITNYFMNKYDGRSGRTIVMYDPVAFNNLDRCEYYQFDYAYVDKYVYAQNQLSLTGNDELITGISAIGNNGVYTGDGQYLNNIKTQEYKDYFIPSLPNQIDDTSNRYVLQSGNAVNLFSLVERIKMKCTDTNDISTSDAITAICNTLNSTSLTSSTYTNIQNATYHRTFYTENNNKLYYGYFGYNMSNKQSSSTSGGTVHEEFNQIYGVLVCLDDLQIVKEINYTTTWRPFNGYGNSHEDPNANVIFLNYDFTNDEFILFVDTGKWGWSGTSAPYLGMMKINGTTGKATTQSWQIGKNDTPHKYTKITNLRYDLTTQRLILPLSSWDSGSSPELTRILKMDLSGNKSVWVNTGYALSRENYLGGEESFYTFEPIYYYEYTDSNDVIHCYLKRIDNDKMIEIPRPYSLKKDYRAIYNGYLYYIGLNKLEDNTYPLIKVDLTKMTYSQYNTFTKYSARFILVDKIPHIVDDNKIYAMENLVDVKYIFYNSSLMYSDVRIDGVINVDGNIQSEHCNVKTNSNEMVLSKIQQQLYHWKEANTFPVSNGLCMVYPGSFENSTVDNKNYMYNSVLLADVNYNGTIDPFDYNKALETAIRIEGKSSGK